MIPEEQRNCRNCAHCIPSRLHVIDDKCLKVGGERCSDVLNYLALFPRACRIDDLKHWSPKPLNIFQKYWKWLNAD